MSESIGLSIGAANLVAARVGGTPVPRRSVLTVRDNRASEVGVPEENPNLAEPGVVMRGFVERVGDRSPLVAADGAKYLGAALMVEALEAMARTVGHGLEGGAVTIAVPAYWSESQSAALRDEFFAQPTLARDGVPPTLISDATAALAALRARPGFPTDGVVAVCDFGAGGTSVTLSNAGSDFDRIGVTLRHPELSGDAIDQLILNHLRSSSPDAAAVDPAATARQGSLTRLLAECRHAKEQLSAATVAVIAGGQLSRKDFEQLISGPLDLFVGNIEELLQRNGIPRTSLGAVATVGGGAGIPLITTRLSERLQVPVFTSPQPMFSAAVGAALLGQRESSGGIPTDMVAGAPTEVSASAWATRAADDPKSATHRALAWSQDHSEEPVPYAGPDYVQDTAPADFASGPVVADERYAAEPATLPWYKRTALVLSVAGAGAAILVAVLLAVNLGTSKTTPNEPSPPTTSVTTTVIGPNNSPTVTVLPPPPVTGTTASSTTTASTTPTTSSTTTSTSAPTSSSTSTTTSTSTSTTTTTTPSTTTQQSTTTAAPVTPTTAAPAN